MKFLDKIKLNNQILKLNKIKFNNKIQIKMKNKNKKLNKNKNKKISKIYYIYYKFINIKIIFFM